MRWGGEEQNFKGGIHNFFNYVLINSWLLTLYPTPNPKSNDTKSEIRCVYEWREAAACI